MKEAKHKRLHTVCFYLYRVLGESKLIYEDEIRAVSALGAGVDWKGCMRKLSGVIEMFYFHWGVGYIGINICQHSLN